MIPFFRYTRPIWNLNLNQKSNNLFKLYDAPTELSSFIDKNINYDNDGVIKLDISYQLWSNGYIVKNYNEPYRIDQSDISLNDNYKLLARFSKKRWLFATWVFRILELNNPFNETLALINNLSVEKFDSSKLRNELKQRIEKKWDKFRLSDNISNSLVSVIIPTLNRYDHLKMVLHDLEKQSFKNFEVIIIDQSDSYSEKFYKGWNLKIKYFRQNEKALWLARNNAIKASKGSFILLTEDDVRFKKNFILNHLKVIDYFDCDISNGIFYSKGSSLNLKNNFFKISDQFPTGNTLLKKKVFESVGLFDRQFEKQRMGDGEFGTRCYLAGKLAISNPLSSCIDIKAATGGLREMGSWDSWRPKSIFSPRPIPSVLYYSRKYWGNKLPIINAVLTLPRSISPYSLKKSGFGKLLSYFLFILFFPIFLFQFLFSWRTATKMLNQGELIDNL